MHSNIWEREKGRISVEGGSSSWEKGSQKHRQKDQQQARAGAKEADMLREADDGVREPERLTGLCKLNVKG